MTLKTRREYNRTVREQVMAVKVSIISRGLIVPISLTTYMGHEWFELGTLIIQLKEQNGPG